MGTRDRKISARQRLLDIVPDLRLLDRQPAVHAARNLRKHRRIELRDAAVLKRERSKTLERTDERGRAAPAARDLRIESHPPFQG